MFHKEIEIADEDYVKSAWMARQRHWFEFGFSEQQNRVFISAFDLTPVGDEGKRNGN